MVKFIVYIVIICCAFSVHGQHYHGYVENENKEALYGVKIKSGLVQLTTDWNGRFELKSHKVIPYLFNLMAMKQH